MTTWPERTRIANLVKAGRPIPTAPGKHGRYQTYLRGCRCDACRDYQNDRVRRNRAARLASGDLNHGLRSAYDAGCRCPLCIRARQLAYQQVDQRARGGAA